MLENNFLKTFHSNGVSATGFKSYKVDTFGFFGTGIIPTIHNIYCDGRYVIRRMKCVCLFVCLCVCVSLDNLSTNASILFILRTQLGVCPD